jgi:nucleoid-associated protein YgaU
MNRAMNTVRTAATIRDSPTTRQRAAGLMAVLGIGAIVVGFPLLLLTAQRALWPPDLSFATAASVLASPDGTGLIVAAVLAGWLLWAWLTGAVLIQVAALVSNIRLPRLPGLPHDLAGRLVAAAALLFFSVPTAQALAPNETVAAVAPLDPQQAHRPVPAESVGRASTSASASASASAHQDTSPVTTTYTVKRNDTLWALARDHLGDGNRWKEIFNLNRKVLGPEPDFLPTGVVLRLPAQAGSGPTEATERTASTAQSDPVTHVVQPGDTLSQVASDYLNDPNRYPKIVRTSAATTQPGGQHLVDSDLIQPGWTLTIPAVTSAEPASHQEPPATSERDTNRADEPDHQSTEHSATPHTTEPSPAPPVSSTSPTLSSRPGAITPWTSPTLPRPTSTPLNGSATDREPEMDAPSQRSDDTDETGPSSYLAPGLTGAGAILAAGLYLALQRKRALQLRYRRPGRAIRPDPAVTVPVEQTLRVSGPDTLSDVERLDRLLLALAGVTEGSTLPRPGLVAVELSGTQAVLHLAEPAELPLPWAGSDARWSAPLNAADVLGDELPGFKPYPLLVTIGQDDAGQTWLLDLERARHLVVTGDPTQVADFGRALTAELAVNPWSEHLTPHTIGFDHLPTSLGIDSTITTHDDNDAATTHPALGSDTWIEEIAAGVRAGYTASGDDREWFHAVIAMGHGTTLSSLENLITVLLESPARPGAAVVTLGKQPGVSDVVAEVSAGRIRLTALGLDLDLAVAGLSESELDAAAAIVQISAANALDDVPIPVPVDDDGQDALTDVTGTPRADVVQDRPADPEQPAGTGSLLPAASTYYQATGITTSDELDRIAPVTPRQTAESIIASDPELDADVTEWFADTPTRPRLMLLGPVSLRTGQPPGEAIRHKARLIEYAAYLGLHPNGIPREALADALQIPQDRIRKDLADLRKWLGTNPSTGDPYVPTTRQSDVFLQTGSQGYQVNDLLIDTDVFLRLRRRAHARGSAGITDLHTALKLVRGRPFDLLRRDGWGWLTEGDRHDLIIGHAVVDVAHTVFLQAMADGDHDLARSAATTAQKSVPQDETIRLDLVQLEQTLGNVEIAEQKLREDIFDRNDHGLVGIDLPERTREALENKQDSWERRRRERTAPKTSR